MMYKNRFTVQSTPFTMFTICSPVSTGRQVFSKSHTNAMSTGRQVKVFSKSHTNAMYTGQQVFFKSHTNAMSTGRQVDRLRFSLRLIQTQYGLYATTTGNPNDGVHNRNGLGRDHTPSSFTLTSFLHYANS